MSARRTVPLERAGESAELLEQLVKSAVERCRQSDAGRGLERQSLRRSLAVLGAITAVATAVFTLRAGVPAAGRVRRAGARHGHRSGEPVPNRCEAGVGHDCARHGRVGRGAARRFHLHRGRPVHARERRRTLRADADDVGGRRRRRSRARCSGSWSRSTTSSSRPACAPRCSGSMPPRCPFVERMEMEFVYPAYTGLGPRTIDHGGDIAALRGTTVRLRVHSTMATKAGRIVRDEREHLPLIVNADGTLSGTLQVKENGIYRIELATPAGTLVIGIAAVHHRRADRRSAVRGLPEAGPGSARDEPGRDLRGGGSRRRLRREAARPGVRRERRAREAR